MKPPISDPFGAPQASHSDSQTRTFDFDLWRVFIGTLFFAVIVALIVWVIMFPVGPTHSYGKVKFVFAFASFWIMLAFGVIPAFFMRVQITEAGLKAPDFWGLSREVAWEHIKKARYRWMVWPYLVISTPTKRNFIWLPLFLRDMKGFARAVEEWAPADNPLRLFLQKHGF